MKEKIKIRFSKIKPGDCFKLTLNGPVYMKDKEDAGQIILGKNLGRVWACGYDCDTPVYSVKVKIVEVK